MDRREMDARTQLLRDALERNTRPGEYAKLLLQDLIQAFHPVPERLGERYEGTVPR